MRLSDTGRTVADPREDVRGKHVKDSDGTDIGTVADLLVDADEGRVRFLRVEHGGILGFGATPSFVPVEAVTAVLDEAVLIDQSSDRVAGAPRYDPELTDQADYYGDVYGYYGYPPFWVPGYVHPPFPPPPRRG
ncbi:PRC-barrel domain-containing protein [Asanoa siamensis]|uniref:PRC-barrel domain-containing protein n=1 Tax=Asanoa siamensis TaxID=926357 RepID=UPI001EF3574A|nr:PRC-barrel domain-containing protein [Asanoa siamensis]